MKWREKGSGKTYILIYGRIIWDAPTPTITTRFYGYGNSQFGHPERDRALILREVSARVGDDVSFELGGAIGVSVLNHIAEANSNDQ